MPPPSTTISVSTSDSDAVAGGIDTPGQRELSLRAVLTGVLLGVVLTPSNVYAGLKIGWAFNMSIIALLIGFGFWQGMMARSRLDAA